MKSLILKKHEVSILLLPLAGYFLSFFAPIGSKANNNIFYLAVMVPFVLWVTKKDLSYIFNSRIVIITTVLTSYLVVRSFFFIPSDLLRYFDPIRHLFSFISFFVVSIALFKKGIFCNQLNRIALWAATWGGCGAVYYYSQHGLGTRLRYLGPVEHEILGACVYAVICVFALFSEKKNYRFFIFGASILLFCCVLLSQSRGPLLALSFAILVAGVVSGRKRLVSGLVVLFGGIWLYNHHVGLFFNRLFIVTSSRRFDIWKQVVVDSWQDGSWVFGHSVLANHEVTVGNTMFYHAHSGYVATFYQSGIIGFFILMSLVFVVGWQVFKLRKVGNCPLRVSLFVFSLLIILSDTHNLLDGPGAVWFYFWLPLAYIAADELQYCHTS